MNQLEQKAFEMRRMGKSMDEIERSLGWEFLFFNDALTGKVIKATQWKPVCKSCFNA